MVSKDYDTMREYTILAAEDGAFGPPDSLPLSDDFAHEFIKTLITYYRIISHRAEGDYAFENTILPPEPVAAPPVKPKKPQVMLKETLKRTKPTRSPQKAGDQEAKRTFLPP
jgi:hypothetical protein